MRTGKLKWVVAAGLFLSIGSVCVPAADTSDPYLQILEEEAKTLELIKSAERMDAASTATVTATGSGTRHTGQSDLALGLTREQFEEALKARYTGTNTLYVKLPEASKQRVYAGYQRDSRIMEVRRAIATQY